MTINAGNIFSLDPIVCQDQVDLIGSVIINALYDKNKWQILRLIYLEKSIEPNQLHSVLDQTSGLLMMLCFGMELMKPNQANIVMPNFSVRLFYLFNRDHHGKPRVSKQLVEAIDDENNSITFKLLEGDLMEQYKSFRVTIKCIPKGDKESVIKWTVKYKKLHDEIIDPHTLLEFFSGLSKDLEKHLTEA